MNDKLISWIKYARKMQWKRATENDIGLNDIGHVVQQTDNQNGFLSSSELKRHTGEVQMFDVV